MANEIITLTTEPEVKPVIDINELGKPEITPPPVVPTVEDVVTPPLSSVEQAELLKSPAVQKILEQARKQEKDKLYKALEDKEEVNKKLTKTLEEKEAQLKLKEETTMAGEQELLAQISALTEGQKKMMAEIDADKKKIAQEALEAYKQKAIEGANGELITVLVNGSSKEEIDASLAIAKEEYQKIVAPLKSKLEESEKPNPENAPKPSNPVTPPVLEYTAEQLRAMPPAEYAKHRESIMTSLKG